MHDFSLLVSLPANNFAKTFQHTTPVIMEQQTKDVQSQTESRAKYYQCNTVLEGSYSFVTTSSASNATDVNINELGTCTGQ